MNPIDIEQEKQQTLEEIRWRRDYLRTLDGLREKQSRVLTAEYVWQKILLRRQKGESAISTGIDWWDEWAGPFRRSNVYCFAGYQGTGKAQPLDSVIYTPTGPKKMGDIRVGDFVIGADGKPTKVLTVHPQGIKPAYRVTFSDGVSAECSLDHLWTTVSRNRKETTRRKRKTMTLNEMIKNKLRFPSGPSKWKIPICSPVEYCTPTPKYNSYIIGVLIGDAALSGNIVDIASMDDEIIDHVRESLPSGYSIIKREYGSCPHYTVKSTTSRRFNGLKRHLRELGLCVTSAYKFIPSEYLYAPVKDRIDLLRGLMDTDGSIGESNRVSFSTSSLRLAKDIKILIQSLGGTAKINDYSRHGRETKEYNIRIRLRFNPFYLKRKANKWNPSRNIDPFRNIESVEYIGDKEQQCISIDSRDGLYLTDDFICTHNTTLAVNLTWPMARRGVKVWNYCLELTADETFEVVAGHILGKAVIEESDEAAAYAEIQSSGYRFFEPERDLSWEQHFEIVQKNVRAEKIDLVVIDNFSYLTSVAKNSYETERVAAKALKGLAQELEIPIIVIAHLRKPDRDDTEPKPTAHSVLGSGAITQVASEVFILHHPLEDSETNSRQPVGYILSGKPRWTMGGKRYVRFDSRRRYYGTATAEEYKRKDSKNGAMGYL